MKESHYNQTINGIGFTAKSGAKSRGEFGNFYINRVKGGWYKTSNDDFIKYLNTSNTEAHVSEFKENVRDIDNTIVNNAFIKSGGMVDPTGNFTRSRTSL